MHDLFFCGPTGHRPYVLGGKTKPIFTSTTPGHAALPAAAQDTRVPVLFDPELFHERFVALLRLGGSHGEDLMALAETVFDGMPTQCASASGNAATRNHASGHGGIPAMTARFRADIRSTPLLRQPIPDFAADAVPGVDMAIIARDDAPEQVVADQAGTVLTVNPASPDVVALEIAISVAGQARHAASGGGAEAMARLDHASGEDAQGCDLFMLVLRDMSGRLAGSLSDEIGEAGSMSASHDAHDGAFEAIHDQWRHAA